NTSSVDEAAKLLALAPAAVLSRIRLPAPCLARLRVEPPLTRPVVLRATSAVSLTLKLPLPLTVVLVKVSFFPDWPATFKVLPADAVKAPRHKVLKAPPRIWMVALPVTLTALGRAVRAASGTKSTLVGMTWGMPPKGV